MADVTRAEFDDLVRRVNLLDGSGTGTEPPAAPRPTGITLGVPVVKVKNATYAIVAKATPNETLAAVYFQIAVRGPGAKDLALHPGQKFTAGEPVTINGSGVGTGGTYTAFLAYTLDGTTWVDGPKATFTVPGQASTTKPDTPLGDRRIGLVGASKLPFNSLVFRQTPAEAKAFGLRRGRPVDGLLTFSGRQNWQDFRWIPDGTVEYAQAGNLVVNSMPHAPESEGSAMNERGADNKYQDQQRDLGKHLADAGLNVSTYVIRIDWECNGDWYAWSANRAGGSEALKEAIRNYVTNVRAGGLTKVRFDLCFNKGPSQSKADFAIFPGPQYIDVIGVDQYDMWGPARDDTQWQRELDKVPSMRTVAQFAATQGVMWSLDEGGNTHGGSAQGGDNPFYWEATRATLDVYGSNLAWHNTYDHGGAPSTLRHDFDSNPASWEKYKELWGR